MASQPRNHELRVALNDRELEYIQLFYGKGKRGKARIRAALINPHAEQNTAAAERKAASLDLIRAELVKIIDMLECQAFAGPMHLDIAMIYVLLMVLWQKILEDDR